MAAVRVSYTAFVRYACSVPYAAAVIAAIVPAILKKTASIFGAPNCPAVAAVCGESIVRHRYVRAFSPFTLAVSRTIVRCFLCVKDGTSVNEGFLAAQI